MKQQTVEGTDTPLSQACDDLLNARSELESAKQYVENAQKEFISQMQNANKTAVQHSGRLFLVRHIDEKDTVSIR